MPFSIEFCQALPRITDLQKFARDGDIGEDEESELTGFNARFADELAELDRLDAVSDARCESDDAPYMLEDMVWPF